MELKRRVLDRIYFVLVILGNIATALSGQNLHCTNDYETLMFCQFDAQNCTEYNVTLRSNDWHDWEKKHCIFKQCEVGRCCCSVHEMVLVMGETHTATVWKGGEIMESKIISVRDSIKPKTPTITSVEKSNGNFQINWRTNYKPNGFSNSLTANVTYHKEGDTEKVSVSVIPTTLDGLNNYEIVGRHLEPSTTYVVSVKSYRESNDMYSDSSEEWPFTTPMSTNTLAYIVISTLSIAAIIISGAIYCCCVKLKTKWWDTVAKCPNPKLLLMKTSEQEILKPLPPIISSVCVEPLLPDDSNLWSKGSLRDSSPQQSSGISTGSSCLSYATTEPVDIIAGVQDALFKAFPNISPISPLPTNLLTEFNNDCVFLSSPHNPCGVRAGEMSYGSSAFDNKSYSILIPSCPQQILTDSSEEADPLCDSVYHSCAGDTAPCVVPQAPAFPLVNLPPVVLSPMPTDMSYQQCNADSGGFTYTEDTFALCDPVSRVEAGCESFDGAAKLHEKTEGAAACDENPCYGCVPAGAHSFPPVDYDYQAFQNLVEQPDILFSEERRGEKEEHLNEYPEELITRVPQSFLSSGAPGFMNDVQGDQCLSELQRPFPSLNPAADQSMPLIVTDNGYQSV